MSSPLTAVAIDSLDGFELTADGQYLVFGSNHPERIALHCSIMPPLLAAIANALGRSRQIRGDNARTKFVMPCEAWEIGKELDEADSGRHLVVSFRLPGGAELSFRLDSQEALRMNEVLSLVTGHTTAGRPDGLSLQ